MVSTLAKFFHVGKAELELRHFGAIEAASIVSAEQVVQSYNTRVLNQLFPIPK